MSLKSHMERSAGVKFVPAANVWENVRTTRLFQEAVMFLQRLFGAAGAKPNKVPALPQHNVQPVPAIRDNQFVPNQQQSLHIMTCMHENRYGKSLSQERVESVSTDRDLFILLNEQFKKRRGGLASKVSIRAIQGILFIKVSCL
jgi:hypothetical protein